MITAILASLGGVGGIALLLSRGVITGAVSHLVRRFLVRRRERRDAGRR